MFCTRCGSQVREGAAVCSNCGAPVGTKGASGKQMTTGNQYASGNQYAAGNQYVQPARQNDSLATVIKVFMIIGCISTGWAIIPLIWCIPMTVSVFKKLNNGYPIGTGMKICVLLFVNLIAGICLLCRNDY